MRRWDALRFAFLRPPVSHRADAWDRADQQLCVGVLRRFHHQLDIAGLHNRGAVKHQDRVGDLIGRGEVVGDVQDRDSQLLVQLAQAAENGRAQRGVHHRHRLVGDDQPWAQQQRARHHDALPLPAGELVRIAAEDFLGTQADGAQCLLDQPSSLRPCRRQTEFAHRRRQHVVHPVERIVDLVRVLEDRLHLAAELPSLRGRQLGQWAPVVSDLTLGGFDQTQQQPRQGGFAAAAFADHRGDPRQRRVDGEREMFERNFAIPPEHAAGEVLRDVTKFKQRRHAKWQATLASSLMARTVGFSVRQRACTCGQRG